jgi:hypothetical protein
MQGRTQPNCLDAQHAAPGFPTERIPTQYVATSMQPASHLSALRFNFFEQRLFQARTGVLIPFNSFHQEFDGQKETDDRQKEEPGQLDVDVIVVRDAGVGAVAAVAAKVQATRDVEGIVDLGHDPFVDVGLGRQGVLQVVVVVEEGIPGQVQAALVSIVD